MEETAEETVEAAAEEAAVGEEPAENAEEAENGARVCGGYGNRFCGGGSRVV